MRGAALRRFAFVLAAFVLSGCVSSHTSVTTPSADSRRTGFEDMSPALQAMQLDDTQNPAMLWVREGEALWSQVPATGQSCASCHSTNTSAASSTHNIQTAATRHPAFDAASNQPVTLAGRVDLCRQRHQNQKPQSADNPEVLALSAWLMHQARGLPIAPPSDPRMTAWTQRGEQLYLARMGQLNLACTHCHDQYAGQRLGGAPIPQAHPTGYPTYRLEWQALGSLPRRLRACMTGVRAEPFAPDSAEWLALESYLMKRAAGMKMEGAAVRP
jgi:L-cysteine S-thiosulfotransferase